MSAVHRTAPGRAPDRHGPAAGRIGHHPRKKRDAKPAATAGTTT
ncbi:hypothetical protein [Streptomyces sp. NPDC059788]